MANTDNRFGLKPVMTRDGSPYNGKSNPYFIPSTYATALFIGDPVVKTGTANTAAAGVSKQFAIATLPEINKATAGTGNATTGVIIGFEVDPNNEDRVYNPASTERVAYVADSPDLICEIQADSVADLAATDIGNNANYIFTHAGDTNTGLSGVELNTSTITTTNTLQMHLLRLVGRADVDLTTNTKVLVSINNHTESNTATGI